jgi:hypothetical protein
MKRCEKEQAHQRKIGFDQVAFIENHSITSEDAYNRPGKGAHGPTIQTSHGLGLLAADRAAHKSCVIVTFMWPVAVGAAGVDRYHRAGPFEYRGHQKRDDRRGENPKGG